MSSEQSRVREFLDGLTIKELELAKDLIDKIISVKAQNKEITEMLVKSVQQTIDEHNLTLDKLLYLMDPTSKKKFKRVPKYIFPDDHGRPQQWAGVGKTPTRLEELLKEGHTLEEYRVFPKEK